MLKAKLDKHNNFYDEKFNQFKMNGLYDARALKRLERIALHAKLTTAVAAEYTDSLDK